jgi:hypothetical protein
LPTPPSSAAGAAGCGGSRPVSRPPGG